MHKLIPLLPSTLPHHSLYLDNKNPRFVGHVEAKSFVNLDIETAQTQESIRRFLLNNCGVNSLINSILNIGFLQVDHIVVSKIRHDKFVVIEGNRRVAAIKSIIGNHRRKDTIIDNDLIFSFNNINVLTASSVAVDLNDIEILQGIRHTSGIRKWGPLQQAKLLRKINISNNFDTNQSASVIGVTPHRAKSLIHALLGFEQFENNTTYGKFADPCLFSHFEQCYLKTPVRAWLNWDEQYQCYTNSESLHFLYKSIIARHPDSKRPLLAREIRDYLPHVLENHHARQAYLSGEVDIHTAFSIAQPQNTQLRSFLDNATSLIRQMKIDPGPVNLSAKDLKTLAKLHALTGNLLQQQNQAG